MSKLNVAINGFGRIGRLSFRNLIENPNIEVVGINDLTSPEVLAHLLKYDSAHGQFNGTVAVEGSAFVINGKKINIYAERDPQNLPWGALNVDVVVESTGIFLDKEGASKHLTAGAKKVIISAPAKGSDIKTVVLGVNDEILNADDKIVSNASCTTNCLAPMIKVMDELYGVESGYITTVHAYTSDQNLQDAPHRDLRRARAAAISIIPTSTGAAKAVGLVLPHMAGKLDGSALRVPTLTGSITDTTLVLKKEANVADINAAFKKAGAEGSLKGILQYTEDPLVSVDIIGNKYSCIFDSDLTAANGKLVKVVGWYDNEAGYSARVADLVVKFGNL
ncbi:MAG: type I glyceraldehyde-3-phosphate dehydrogenase [Luteibaculaceae bacterium]